MSKRKVQVVVFYFNEKDSRKYFLLLKTNKRRGLFWQNITGGVEKDESYLDGALRECMEETGFNRQNIESILDSGIEFQFIDQWNNDVTEKVFFLQCRQPWDVIIDPHEHCEFKWISELQIRPEEIKYKSNSNAIMEACKLN